MKILITIGIMLITFLSANGQEKIDDNIYQILKGQEVLYSNEEIKLIGETKNEKIYKVVFQERYNYDEAILIVYGVDSFEFIYDTQMGKNHNKIILSKQYSTISKTVISTGSASANMSYTSYEQYHNGRKIFKKTY